MDGTGSPDDAGDDMAPPGSESSLSEPEILLEEPFQVAPSQSAVFTVTVPEGASNLTVWVQVDQSVYLAPVWLDGLGDCDDLSLGATGANINLGENNGSGGSECTVPKHGETDVTLGIDEGVSTGILTITAS